MAECSKSSIFAKRITWFFQYEYNILLCLRYCHSNLENLVMCDGEWVCIYPDIVFDLFNFSKPF